MERIRELLDSDLTAWFAGVALPLAMVILDPIVFRGNPWPILGSVSLLGYLAIGIGIVALSVHLLATIKTPFMAGVLAAGSAFAAGLGAILFPYALVGIFFSGLGLLGLSPFVTAAVLARRAYQTYRGSQSSNWASLAFAGFAAFFSAAGGPQLAAVHALKNAVDQVCIHRTEAMDVTAPRLATWRYVLYTDSLVLAWQRAREPRDKDCIALLYERTTGVGIAERATELAD